MGRTAKVCFGGVITKKLPQRESSSQNTPFFNFLTTQPIPINSNSTDAAWQVQHQSLNTSKISV
jgi:hypothetical protein